MHLVEAGAAIDEEHRVADWCRVVVLPVRAYHLLRGSVFPF
jgi:hypothetical protein